MRILFISPSFGSDFAAISRYVGNMTDGLAQRGHACHVLTWQAEILVQMASDDGIVIHQMRRGYWPLIEKILPESRESWTVFAAAMRLDRIYHFDAVEIVSNEGIELLAVRYFDARAIVRVFTSLAQMVATKEVTRTRKVRVRLCRERLMLRWASRVSVPSIEHRNALEVAGVPGDKLRILPLGIPDLLASRESKADRRESAPPSLELGPIPAPVFLYVGTLDRRKGSDRLGPVMREYCKMCGPCELRIVSNSPKTMLQAFGIEADEKLGLCVSYATGLSDAELHEQYRHATVLFHPARYESFGLTLIEAAAAGLPVVTTRVGVAPELLDGDLSRFLVDSEDPEGFVKALVLAVQVPKKLGALFRARYEWSFTREAMVNSWLQEVEKPSG